MRPDPTAGFCCPLRGPCFPAAATPFPSIEACNRAVARFRAALTSHERHARARWIYRRCLPLVRKTLHRFCHPYRPSSRCYPGGCLPEDLIGETYPIFWRTLNAYDPSVGVDFLGYLSWHLFWGLEHRARRLERRHEEMPRVEPAAEEGPQQTAEDRLLDGMLVEDLIGRLEQADAELITRYATGHTCQELAAWAGISNAAVRKRLERLRARLRAMVPAD